MARRTRPRRELFFDTVESPARFARSALTVAIAALAGLLTLVSLARAACSRGKRLVRRQIQGLRESVAPRRCVALGPS
jgi:hypothetical protein